MPLRLQRPEKTTEQLIALAASGASGFAKKAQAALGERLHAKLSAEIGRAPPEGKR